MKKHLGYITEEEVTMLLRESKNESTRASLFDDLSVFEQAECGSVTPVTRGQSVDEQLKAEKGKSESDLN